MDSYVFVNNKKDKKSSKYYMVFNSIKGKQ